MGLTQKILLFTSLLVVALVLASLGFTTFQAERLAQENIEKGLTETKGLWETFQADRFSKLKLGIRAISNDPGFKAFIQAMADDKSKDAYTPSSTPSRSGTRTWPPTSSWPRTRTAVVLARSDRPGVQGEDLSQGLPS